MRETTPTTVLWTLAVITLVAIPVLLFQTMSACFVSADRSLMCGIFMSSWWTISSHVVSTNMSNLHAPTERENMSSLRTQLGTNNSVTPRLKGQKKMVQPGPAQHGSTQYTQKSALSSSAVGNEESILPITFLPYLSPIVQSRFFKLAVGENCMHKQIMRKFSQGSRIWNDSKTVIWSCTGASACGGLADRMKGITSAFYAASALGYGFRVDWSKPLPIMPAMLKEGKLSWNKSVIRSGKVLRAAQIDSPKRPFNLCEWSQYDVVEIRTNLLMLPNEDGKCNRTSMSIQEIIGHQRSRSRKGIGCAWWYLFAIGELLEIEVLNQIRRLRDWKLARNQSSGPTIGIHVRAGDSEMNAGRGREAKNMHKMLHEGMRCAEVLSESIGSGKMTVVLVSDSSKIKQFASQNLNVFASDAAPFHVDRSRKGSRKQVMAGFTGAWVDLILLSLCDGLVLTSTSGYGFLAEGIGLFGLDQVRLCPGK
mmetsp:Transcript_44449/g.69500  ORF Transcript_44449/g.69500 Transcript_44449/m.69500 type:complete len:479 (-) Transcript_44449:59-1495(-)